VDFHGNHYRVHAALDQLPPQRLPIIASGLNPRAIETAAQLADGLVTLLAPPSYLSQVVRPRIAARLSRRDFSLVACVPVILTRKTREAATAAQKVYGPFWGYTGYASMLRAARCNDITDIAAIGDEDTITAQLARYAAAGVTEIAAAPSPSQKTRPPSNAPSASPPNRPPGTDPPESRQPSCRPRPQPGMIENTDIGSP
jgi:alkanesulfonate monooxygenase SsuD/methylene tetrahydromethanopterin reductase-like flavin-dependent oxidoreductase (luciferase family)